MKKFVAFVFLCCLCQFSLAQRVVHHSYITYYDAAKGEPDSVSWNLTPEMVSCTKGGRHDAFKADPLIPGCTISKDYTRSGYDRGHLFPFADAECSDTDRLECFYMSNMVPQLHTLNAGDWEALERQERVWAASGAIHIIAGGYGSKGKLASGVNIPESCWKAVFVGGVWHVYIMPNETTSSGHDYTYWEVKDLKRFDRVIGLPL